MLDVVEDMIAALSWAVGSGDSVHFLHDNWLEDIGSLINLVNNDSHINHPEARISSFALNGCFLSFCPQIL